MNSSCLNLLAKCILSNFLCSSVFLFPLMAPQFFICCPNDNSSIFLLIASSFCFNILLNVLCLISLIFSYAINSASALGSSTYFLNFFSYRRSSSLYNYYYWFNWSYSFMICTKFCCNIYYCCTCLSFAITSPSAGSWIGYSPYFGYYKLNG